MGNDEGGVGHSLRYFGSWSNALVAQDFSKEELADLTLRKQILFESDSKEDVRRMEVELILRHHSNDPPDRIPHLAASSCPSLTELRGVGNGMVQTPIEQRKYNTRLSLEKPYYTTVCQGPKALEPSRVGVGTVSEPSNLVLKLGPRR